MHNNRRFYTLLGVVIVAGLVLAGALSLLLLQSGPRLRSATPTYDLAGQPAASGQLVQLVFNRPLAEADYAAAIEVEPQAAYRVTQAGNRLVVTFTENLQQDTTYTVRVNAGVRDTDGREARVAQTSSFKTGPATMLHVVRHDTAPDELRHYTLTTRESEVLYAADTIKFFAANSAFIAVAVEQANSPGGVVIIDRKTGSETMVEGIDGLALSSLRLAQRSPVLTFVATGSETSQQLYIYDISTKTLKGSAQEVTNIAPTPDGRHVVYQRNNGLVYAQNAAKTEELPTLLGSFIGISDFDQGGSKILLQSEDGVEVYDASTRERTPVSGMSTADSALAFVPNLDGVLYRNYQPGQAEPTIEVRQGDHVVTAFEPPADHYFFGQPRPSIDGRYIVVETAASDARLDSYRLNPKPKGAVLRIFDRLENRYLDVAIPGVDPIFE